MSENASKLKEERHKFYDALLQKILALPSVQEYIKDLKTGEITKGKPEAIVTSAENGEGEQSATLNIKETKISGIETEYDYEQSALEDFFEGDVIDILVLVEEIWGIVKKEIREEAEWITSDVETLRKNIGFNVEDTVNDKLNEISNELDHALKRKHKK